jgi:hypothetical protein
LSSIVWPWSENNLVPRLFWKQNSLPRVALFFVFLKFTEDYISIKKTSSIPMHAHAIASIWLSIVKRLYRSPWKADKDWESNEIVRNLMRVLKGARLDPIFQPTFFYISFPIYQIHAVSNIKVYPSEQLVFHLWLCVDF